MKSDFLIAVTQLMAERGLPQTKVMAAVEDALVSAYKKEGATGGHDITVRLNPGSGTVDVFILKSVVEEVTDDKREMTLAEAKKVRSDAAIDEVLELPAPFQTMGRIAAQTAKQVVLQRLREAERELILEEYVNRVGEILPGRIDRAEPQHLVVNLGKTEAIMPREEQVPIERFRPGVTMQFYLVEVAQTIRGPDLIVSRAHRNLVRRLFEREVPEIYKGIVEIMAIAREPGSRTKVAVVARQEGVDPVGSCVGLRGFRIQTIVNELQGEKIDVVQWSENPATFLASALSPAQVLHVELNETERIATIIVPDRQLSLAIGKEGQNARLTARLTGWKIEIRSQTEYEERPVEPPQPVEAAEPEAAVAAVETPVPSVAEIVEAVAAPQAEEAGEPVLEPAVAEVPVEAPVAEPTPAQVAEAKAVAEAAELAELAELAALEELEAKEAEEQAPAAEEAGISLDDDSLWVVPDTVREPSVLRFAEDIMPERGRRQDTRAKTTESAPRAAAKSKSGKRSRAPVQPGGGR